MEKRYLILALLFSFLAGVGATLTVQAWTKPNCSQEDMCSVDYRNGKWHIIERESGTY